MKNLNGYDRAAIALAALLSAYGLILALYCAVKLWS